MNGLKKYTDGKEMINRREANKCRAEGAERAIKNSTRGKTTGKSGTQEQLAYGKPPLRIRHILFLRTPFFFWDPPFLVDIYICDPVLRPATSCRP